MNDNSAYEKEILNKIKDIEKALRYYIDKNKDTLIFLLQIYYRV